MSVGNERSKIFKESISRKTPKIFKRCNCCGKFVNARRWIYVGSYQYFCGLRTVCFDCE